MKLTINTNITEKQLDEFIEMVNKQKQTGFIDKAQKLEVPKDIKFTSDMIDVRGNYDFTNNGNEQIRGGMPYYQPKGWIRIGLKVLGQYDNGDNSWLAMNGNPKEWAVGFHGSKAISSFCSIADFGLLSLPNWAHECEKSKNINPFNDNIHLTCGKGVYFGDRIEICERGNYVATVRVWGKQVKIAFQCRINPYETRKTKYDTGNAYIVSNESLGCYDNIRPYGILMKEETP